MNVGPGHDKTENLMHARPDIRFFYSQFQPRVVNPKGYDRKMAYWTKRINEECEEKGSYFRLIDLQEECIVEDEDKKFKPEFNCLAHVLTVMVKEKNLFVFSDFVQDHIPKIPPKLQPIEARLGWETVQKMFKSVITFAFLWDTVEIDQAIHSFTPLINMYALEKRAGLYLDIIATRQLYGDQQVGFLHDTMQKNALDMVMTEHQAILVHLQRKNVITVLERRKSILTSIRRESNRSHQSET